jgi:hypothetical protein
MADASHPFDARRRRPRDWGDAFSNLPLDTPPLSVWSQIEARLNTPTAVSTETSAEAVVMRMPAADRTTSSTPARRKLSSRAWLALAASISALAVLPLLWSNMRETSHTAKPLLAGAASTPDMRTADALLTTRSDTRPQSSQSPITRADADTPKVATVAIAPAPAASSKVAPIESVLPSPLASVSSATPAATDAPLRAPAPVMVDTSEPRSTEVASVETPRDERDALPANAVLVGDADADATEREMEMLYTASAQLETLLAYTRDPRVETGPAAALSSEIHTRLAKIDARLAQPGLSAHEQYALWQARVGTLRQAVAVESELRALSAEGQDYEGEVVEIY